MPRLPSEYQEVEYIQNSGTQYIDIGLNIKDGYRFVSKLNSISAQTGDGGRITGGYLGPDSGITGGHARLYFGGVASNGWSYGYLDNFSNGGFGSASTGVDYEVEFSWVSGNAFIKINGTYIWSSSTTYTTSLPGTISLMASHNQNSTYNIHPGLRVYYAKYYNNSGVLVRNLIPCYRKSDSVIGMYDLVNNVFYTNSGTGNFISGPVKVPKISKVYTRRRVPRLPSAYQEVEYIQSARSSGTSGQYINTGVIPNATNTTIKLKLTPISTSETYYMAGIVTASSNGYYYGLNFSSNRWHCGRGDAGSSGSGKPIIDFSYTWDWGSGVYDVEYRNDDLYINNVLVANATTNTTSFTYPIFLFARNAYGTYDSPSSCILYSCQIYQSDVLVRDFVPCYRKSDNVIGLYDLVDNQFYTNAGSGSFTKGGDVVESVSNTVYKEFLIRPLQKWEEYVLLSNGGSTNRFSDFSISGTQSVRNQTSYWQGYVQSTDSYGISYVVLPKKIVGFEIVMQALSASNYGNAICCLTNSVSDINSSAVRGITKGVWMSISSKNYNGNSTGSASIGGVGTATGGINQSKSDSTATGTFTGTLVNGVWNIGISLSNGQSWTGTMTLNNDVNDMYLIGFRGGGWYTGERSKFVSAKVTLLA